MCGIFAYTGKQTAIPILLNGLCALEYRGYDSAGIFSPVSGVTKAVGPVRVLAERAVADGATSGIAHTRWATHGVPTERNAHPHADCTERLWIVHNGIIENYRELRSALQQKGHSFRSDTDSEVIAHLVEDMSAAYTTMEETLGAALQNIRGTYGIALMDRTRPEHLYVARMGSPIVIGIGDGEYFVASDPSALIMHTKDVLYLNDGECASISPTGYRLFTKDNGHLERSPDRIEWDIESAQKGGFEHFMEKEIMEGPQVLKDSARGRLVLEKGNAKLGGIESIADELANIERMKIVACGSAYYAGLVGKYMLEEHAGIPTEVDIGSEFRYRSLIPEPYTAALAISQSGETADTLASIREAKQKGLLALGIVNTVGSTIARETVAGVYNHAGPEIGVASTKAFISQIEILALLTLFLGRQRTLSAQSGKAIVQEINRLPEHVSRILERRDAISALAEKYASFRDFLYIGRKYNAPIAYEGALKLKEVSYIHAEGYGAGEMKHGPIAMIDEQFPTVAIAPRDSVYEKMVSNIEEIRARKGPVLAIATEGDRDITRIVDDVIYIPKTIEMLSPILSIIPLQLFAYYIGTAKGYDVDKPRNLAKSVTVE